MSNVLLVVEDDELLGRMICRIFDRQGVAPNWAKNFTEVQDALEARHPQLILLDVMLPKTDGFQILEWLKRSDSKVRDIPVIMLSNISDSEHIEHAYKLGAADYIIKSHVDMEAMATELIEKYHIQK